MSYSSSGSNIILSKLTDILFKPERLILINFAVLLIFSMFGTGPNWEPKAKEAFYEESTNLANQVVYVFLFISSLIAVYPNIDKLLSFIKREKYLSIFVAFSLLSAIWSDYTFMSFKRSFQLFVTFMVVIMGVVFIEPRKILQTIKVIVAAYILVNIFTVMVFPEAIDPKFNTWRGITPQKNGLAQSALLCFLFSLLFYGTEKNIISKYIHYAKFYYNSYYIHYLADYDYP
jgi:hypothetical protein